MPKWERDEAFLKGAAAGALGGALRYVYSELLQALGVVQYDTHAASMHVILRAAPTDLASTVFSAVVTLMIGAFWGVLISFAFAYVLTGHRYLLKGALVGIFIWLVEFGMGGEGFKYPDGLLTSPPDVAAVLVGLTIYGVLVAYLLRRFGIIAHESRPPGRGGRGMQD